MATINLPPINQTDAEVQLFVPNDPYRWDVDNRPLRKLIENDQILYTTLGEVVDEINNAHGTYNTLAERLDDIQSQIDAAAGPAYLIGDESENFVFTASNNVLRVRSESEPNYEVVTFAVGTLTAQQVVDTINATVSDLTASVVSGGRVKIASNVSGATSRVFIDSVANGSTANPVLGFDAAGEATDFSTLEARVSSLESEVIAARFNLPSLDAFLAVSLNPDGTIRSGAISFTVTEVQDIILSGAVTRENEAGVGEGFAYNTFFDVDGGLWASSTDVLSTSWFSEPAGPKRGTRREFPSLSAVKIYDDKLIITDLTNTHSPELWRQFDVNPIWVTGTDYQTNDVVANVTSGDQYRCIQDHTADAASEPGVGANWSTYWTLLPAGSGTALFGTPTTVCAHSGSIFVGTAEAGLFHIDLIGDQIYWFNTSGRSTYTGRVADSNTKFGYGGIALAPFALTSNTVNDVDAGHYGANRYAAVATPAGANLINFNNSETYQLTASTNTSSSRVAIYGKMLGLSMGPMNSEMDVYVFTDITSLSGDVNDVPGVANLHFGAHTTPALDAYPTTALDIVGTIGGPALLRGSIHGFKIIFIKDNVHASYAQYYQSTRDISPAMVGDVVGAWVMDMNAAVDEPVDDLSHNQNPLIAKGANFSPVAVGGLHVFNFDGSTQYLINNLDADHFNFGNAGTDQSFHFGFLVNHNGSAESTLIAKWDESNANEKREYKISLVEISNEYYVNVRLYDEANNAYINKRAGVPLPANLLSLVQVRYDGSGTTDGIEIFYGETRVDTDASTSGVYHSMTNTGSPFMVGANIGTTGAIVNHFAGQIGFIGVNREDVSDEIVRLYNSQFIKWSTMTTTRLHGSTNRVVSVSGLTPMAYVGTNDGSNGGAISRIDIIAGTVLDEWSTTSGVVDDDGDSFPSNNIVSVSTGNSLRVFATDAGSWYENDPLDLRQLMALFADVSIDGTIFQSSNIYSSLYYIVTGSAPPSTGGGGGGGSANLRGVVKTVTPTDNSAGFVTIGENPSDNAMVRVVIKGAPEQLNKGLPGAVDPDFDVYNGKVFFKNNVTDGVYTSSGLSEDIGTGDILMIFYTV